MFMFFKKNDIVGAISRLYKDAQPHSLENEVYIELIN